MNWKKHGLILTPSANGNWYSRGFSGSHAVLKDGKAEFYLTGRDSENRSRIGVCSFDMEQMQVTDISNEPILDLGERGTFDFNGTGYPFFLSTESIDYLYYTGWTKGVHVDFINDLGLAVRSKETNEFMRVSRASIFPRTNEEPFGTGSVSVLRESDGYKMWYTSFKRWENQGQGLRHYYHICYAHSDDGVQWHRPGKVCISLAENEGEYVAAKPFVLRYKGLYLMWYAFRGQTYKMGFAVSNNGYDWVRHDNTILSLKASDTGWDSEMVCYASVLVYNGQLYMFYNGNGYGKSGLGLATLSLETLDETLTQLGY